MTTIQSQLLCPGIGMAQTELPDLILMDLTLPVLSGMDAIRKLKQDSQTKSIPVIALTAHALAPDRDEAMRAGCDDYDTKPVALPRYRNGTNGVAGSDSDGLDVAGVERHGCDTQTQAG